MVQFETPLDGTCRRDEYRMTSSRIGQHGEDTDEAATEEER